MTRPLEAKYLLHPCPISKPILCPFDDSSQPRPPPNINDFHHPSRRYLSAIFGAHGNSGKKCQGCSRSKSVRDPPGLYLSSPPPPTPYVHQISPKVTQFDPMLRRSAEGRKSHPYSSR